VKAGWSLLLIVLALTVMFPHDLAADEVTTTLSLGSDSCPLFIAVTPDGDRVYVSTRYRGVYNIDLKTLTVGAPVLGVGQVFGIAVSPGGDVVYAADRTSQCLWLISTSSNSLVGSVPCVEPGQGSIAVSLDGQYVYVPSYAGVRVINTTTRAEVKLIPAGDYLGGVTVTRDGKHLCIAEGITDTLALYDVETDIVSRVPVAGTLPLGVAVTPNGEEVYIACNGDWLYLLNLVVDIISLADGSRIASHPMGGQPAYIAMTPDGRYAYVTISDDNAVRVIDTLTHARCWDRGVAVGDFPWGIAITPDGSRACVANYQDGTVSVIAIAAGEEPTIVADFAASDGEDAKCMLSWTNPADSDLSEVVVCRKTGTHPTSHLDGTQVFVDSSPVRGGHVDYEDGGLANGTTYYYAVFAKNSLGNWNNAVEEGKNADSGEPMKAGSIVVKGTLVYRREWSAESSPPGTPAAVSGFMVELWDREPAPMSDVFLDEVAYTDAYGNFQFPAVENYDGPLQGGLDIYVRVYARNAACKVERPFSQDTYTWNSEVTGGAESGALDLQETVVDDFEMCHAIQLADMVGEVIDWVSSPLTFGHTLSWRPLEVWWPYSVLGAETGWFPGLAGVGIALRVGPSSWAEFDRATMFHEIAHAVWQDIGQPLAFGQHNPFEETNAVQAMVEGWAEFVSAIATGNLQACTNGDMEDNQWWMGGDALQQNGTWVNPNGNSGEIVEGAVASIFYDIADSDQDHPSGDDDPLALGIAPVFGVLEGDRCSSIFDFVMHWIKTDDGSSTEYGHVPELIETCRANGVAVDLVQAGRNATVEFSFRDSEETVTVTFENLTEGGIVSVTRSGPTTGFLGLPVSGCYDVTTDASFTGSLEVEIHYSDAGLTPEQEHSLRIYHITALGTKVDITASVDTTANVVTGRTTSLSGFFIGLPPMLGDLNGDGSVDIVDVRMCLQIASGGSSATADERAAADVDGDGSVELDDARILAEYVVGTRRALP